MSATKSDSKKEIVGITLNKGDKIKGKYKVGESAGHDVNIPYIIYNGEKDGPTLCVLGGIHSLECTSIEAILQLERIIDSSKLNGTLILIPIVNVEGFIRRTPYINDIDHLNQNKVFPGNPDGSMTERIAYSVFEEFVSKSDLLVDAHCADLGEDGTRLVFTYKTEDMKLHLQMLKMASCFDVEYILTSDGKKNSGEAVNKYGIPCIEILSGAPFPIRKKDVDFQIHGIINLMKHLKMLEGDAVLVNVPFNPEMKRIFSNKGGIWRCSVSAGQHVKEGEKLGEIINLVGDRIELIKSPFNGIITFLSTNYSIYSGDTLLLISKI